jgi:hypothetical protein
MLNISGRLWVALASGFHVSRAFLLDCLFLSWAWSLFFALEDINFALAP